MYCVNAFFLKGYKKMNYHKNLKKIMKMKSVDSRTLSDLTGISQSLISFYTRGNRSPGLQNAVKIAVALDVSLDEMVGKKPLSLFIQGSLEGLSKEEKEILIFYRRLDDPLQKQIIRQIIMSYLKE